MFKIRGLILSFVCVLCLPGFVSAIKQEQSSGLSRQMKRLHEYERLQSVLEESVPDLLQEFVPLSEKVMTRAKRTTQDKKAIQAFLKTVAADLNLNQQDKKAIAQFLRSGLSTGAKVGIGVGSAAAVIALISLVAKRRMGIVTRGMAAQREGMLAAIRNESEARLRDIAQEARRAAQESSARAGAGTVTNSTSPLGAVVSGGVADPEAPTVGGTGRFNNDVNPLWGHSAPGLGNGAGRMSTTGDRLSAVIGEGAGAGVVGAPLVPWDGQFRVSLRAEWGVLPNAHTLTENWKSAYLNDAVYNGITTDAEWTNVNSVFTDPRQGFWVQERAPSTNQDFLALGSTRWALFPDIFNIEPLKLFVEQYLPLAKIAALPKPTGVCGVITDGSKLTIIVRTEDARYFAFLCDQLLSKGKIYQLKMASLEGMIASASKSYLRFLFNCPLLVDHYFKDYEGRIKELTEKLAAQRNHPVAFLGSLNLALEEVRIAVNNISVTRTAIEADGGVTGFTYKLNRNPLELVAAIDALLQVLVAEEAPQSIKVGYEAFVNFMPSLIKFMLMQYCVKNNVESLEIEGSRDVLQAPEFFTHDFFVRHDADTMADHIISHTATRLDDSSALYSAALRSARDYIRGVGEVFELSSNDSSIKFFQKLYPISAATTK